MKSLQNRIIALYENDCFIKPAKIAVIFLLAHRGEYPAVPGIRAI